MEDSRSTALATGGTSVAFEIKPRRSIGDSGSYTSSQRQIPREPLGQTERNMSKKRNRDEGKIERERERDSGIDGRSRTKGEGRRGRGEKKEKEPLRSASRCRVHRFRSPPPSPMFSTSANTRSQTYTHTHTHAHDVVLAHSQDTLALSTRAISRNPAPGTRADVPACQIIVCNCRVG